MKYFLILWLLGCTAYISAEPIYFVRKIFNETALPIATKQPIDICVNHNEKVYVLTEHAVLQQTALGYRLLFNLEDIRLSEHSQILCLDNKIVIADLDNAKFLEFSFSGKKLQEIKLSFNFSKILQHNNDIYFQTKNGVVNSKGTTLQLATKEWDTPMKCISIEDGIIADWDKTIVSNSVYLCKNRQWYQIWNKNKDAINYYTHDSLTNAAPRLLLPISDTTVLIGMDLVNRLFVYNTRTNDLEKIDLKSKPRAIANTTIYHAVKINDRSVILLTSNSKLIHYNPATKAVAVLDAVNDFGYDLKNVSTVINGKIYFGTYTGNIIIYDTYSEKIKALTTNDYPALNDVLRLQAIDSNILGIGMTRGFVLLDTRVDQLHFPSNNLRNALLESNITGFVKDRWNNLWIASYKTGIWSIANYATYDLALTHATATLFNEQNKLCETDVRFLNINGDYIYARCKNGLAIIHTTDRKMVFFPSIIGFGGALLNQYNYILGNHYFSGTKGGFLKIDITKPIQFTPAIIDAYCTASDTVFINGKDVPNIKFNNANLAFYIFPFNYAAPASQYIYRYKDSNWIQMQGSAIPIAIAQKGLFNGELQQNNGVTAVKWKHRIVAVWYKSTFFLLSILLLVAGLITYFIWNAKKQNRLTNDARLHEINSLRGQMNPHFISNSLNSINAFILENSTEKASDYIVAFSKLIRQILNNTSVDYIPLEEEVAMNLGYLKMEQLRFKDKFSFAIVVEESVPQDYQVPSMIMQPLIENAIWHGLLQNKERVGHLDIKIAGTTKGINVIIDDNGIGRKAAMALKSKSSVKRKSFGLDLLHRRIQLLNERDKRKYSLVIQDIIQNNTVQGTRAILEL